MLLPGKSPTPLLSPKLGTGWVEWHPGRIFPSWEGRAFSGIRHLISAAVPSFQTSPVAVRHSGLAQNGLAQLQGQEQPLPSGLDPGVSASSSLGSNG